MTSILHIFGTLDQGTIIGLVGVIGGPLVAYLVAAKRFSGRIDSSAAAELWEESRSIRSDYRSRIGELEKLVSALRDRLVLLEEDNSRLKVEHRDCVRQIIDLTDQLKAANRRVAELEASR